MSVVSHFRLIRLRRVACSRDARRAPAILALALVVNLSSVTSAATRPETAPDMPAGAEHTCAIGFGGGVKCWGTNFSGQLGDGTNVNRNTPVDVDGLSRGATAIAAGAEHTCAIVAGGVKCWGANFSGQLGDGTNINRNTPVDVAGLSSGVTAIATGAEHTCAVVTGRVKCWGANFSGQLGDGTNANRSTPVDTSGLAFPIASIATGGSHSCALSTAGDVACWGTNFCGQLGDGSNVDRNTPVGVSGLGRGVAAIAAGSAHTCALGTGGAMECWGTNFSGQLGDGTQVDRNTPVAVHGLSFPVVAIATGGSHSCALSAGGEVKCWGTNYSGQLGDGTQVNRSTPADVSGLPRGATAIAAGSSHTCALTTGGSMQCWGTNFSGQLGDGTNVNRSTPVDVTRLPSERPQVRWRWL